MNRALFCGITLLLFTASEATIRRVSPSSHQTTVRTAIIQAKPGDTLWIGKGVYRESNIIIDKPLMLYGENGAIIDGEKKNEILLIKSDGVTIQGLTIRNGGYSSYNDIAAIRIMNVRHVRILHNRIQNTFFGIYCQHASESLIDHNHIESNAADELQSANGIHCWKSDRMQIRNNTVTGHRDGIYFEFVTNSSIYSNQCFRNLRYGLHFMFSNDDVYESNTFRENGAGVAVMYSHRVTMRKNTFADNWGESAYGLLLKEIADGAISDNQFNRNSTGIYMEGTNRMDIRSNQFRSNGWALKIQASCEGNTITANNFQLNSFDATTNGTLVMNRFNGNFWDKYEGYDLDHDGQGDIPYHPLSLYALLTERNPAALMLFRSFIASLLDRSEKVLPSLTPGQFRDERPLMKPIPLKSVL